MCFSVTWYDTPLNIFTTFIRDQGLALVYGKCQVILGIFIKLAFKIINNAYLYLIEDHLFLQHKSLSLFPLLSDILTGTLFFFFAFTAHYMGSQLPNRINLCPLHWPQSFTGMPGKSRTYFLPLKNCILNIFPLFLMLSG